MIRYGYIKNNYPETTEKQLNYLEKYSCHDILIDYELNSNTKMLYNLLDTLNYEDELVIYDLRSFFMSVKSLKDTFILLDSKKIRLICINNDIDSNRYQTFFHDLIQVFIMDEKHKSHVVKVSIEKARTEGRIGGRPKVNTEIIDIITRLHKNEKKTIREIAEICDVSLGTVHKYIKLKELIE